jgi:hypothetical protein
LAKPKLKKLLGDKDLLNTKTTKASRIGKNDTQFLILDWLINAGEQMDDRLF